MSLQDLISHKIESDILTEESLLQEEKLTTQGVSIRYNVQGLEKEEFQDITSIAAPSAEQTQWIHWSKLEVTPDLLAVFSTHKFHALIAEDIINTSSRIKIEELDDSLIVSTKIPVLDTTENELVLKHFCIVLKKNCVISFSEIPLSLFSDLHRRLASPKRRIRKRGADYLFWAILDVLADYNTLFAESLAEQLDGLEAQLINANKELSLSTIHNARTMITQFHRMAHPCRDIASRLTRTDSNLITKESRLFFRDLFDHASQTVESTEYLREQASNLTELYYTTNSHHMNQVMKVLTSVSAIFLPLTFLAGIYGMNFENMPELRQPWAYPIFLCFLLSIGLGLALLFKKRNWL